MGFVNRWKGKYVTINPSHPHALGMCDESGFMFNHKDLVKQMEWRGNTLVWTGLMVGRPYLDTPNEQNRPPLVKDDPKAIKNPRPTTPYPDPDSPPPQTYKQIDENLDENSFYDDNNPPYGPPSYVLPYSNRPTPGWQDPSPVPSYSILINQLKKVSFQ